MTGFSKSVNGEPVRQISATLRVKRTGTLRVEPGGSGQARPSIVQPLADTPRRRPANVHSTDVGGATGSHTVDQRFFTSSVKCRLRSTAEGWGYGTRVRSAS